MIYDPGVYSNLDMEAYHREESISKSSIHGYYKARSAKHYITPKEKKTKELTFGDVAHLCILQPELYKTKVEVIPASVLAKDSSKRGNAWKAYEAEASARGVITITAEMCMHVENAMNELSMSYNKPAADLLTGGVSEYSFFWRDDPLMGNFPSKVRPDHLPGDRIITDLKTTDSAHFWDFDKIVGRFHYHWSAALTRRGVSIVMNQAHVKYYFVVIEREPPYGIMVYEAAEDHIALAWQQMEYAISGLVGCLKADTWPTYPDGILPLPLPAWMDKQDGAIWE